MMFIALVLALGAGATLLIIKKATPARILATCACLASTVLVMGYFPAIAAHYRLIFFRVPLGEERPPRPPLERPERNIVLVTAIVAMVAAIVVGVYFVLHPPTT